MAETVEKTDVPNAADTVVMSRDDLAKLIATAAESAVNKAKAEIKHELLGGGGPPKSMTAKVHDGFVKGERSASPILKTYRIDGVQAQKIAEIDMERLRYYEENPDELPLDRWDHPISARNMAAKRGKWMAIINGRIGATSQNQIEQLEWMKTLPPEQGGLPGLYELTADDGEDWTCHICPIERRRPFKNRRDWEAHRLATHGIYPEVESVERLSA